MNYTMGAVGGTGWIETGKMQRSFEKKKKYEK